MKELFFKKGSLYIYPPRHVDSPDTPDPDCRRASRKTGTSGSTSSDVSLLRRKCREDTCRNKSSRALTYRTAVAARRSGTLDATSVIRVTFAFDNVLICRRKIQKNSRNLQNSINITVLELKIKSVMIKFIKLTSTTSLEELTNRLGRY